MKRLRIAAFVAFGLLCVVIHWRAGTYHSEFGRFEKILEKLAWGHSGRRKSSVSPQAVAVGLSPVGRVIGCLFSATGCFQQLDVFVDHTFELKLFLCAVPSTTTDQGTKGRVKEPLHLSGEPRGIAQREFKAAVSHHLA